MASGWCLLDLSKETKGDRGLARNWGQHSSGVVRPWVGGEESVLAGLQYSVQKRREKRPGKRVAHGRWGHRKVNNDSD